MHRSQASDFSKCMVAVCKSIEYAIANHNRCIIPYTEYSKWSSESLAWLESNDILRKEQSKKLEYLRCTCEGGIVLDVEYTNQKAPFVQCFKCGSLRNVLPQELMYYEASPLCIAKNLTKYIDDIDIPTTIVKDRAFFVGETKGSVLVYLVCGLKSASSKVLLENCKVHSRGAAFVVISSYVPSVTKNYIIVGLYEKKLYLFSNKNQTLNISFIESHFAKNSQKQEAANIRWRNDPKRKAEEELSRYIDTNLLQWNGLHHVEIANEICIKNPELLMYKTKGGSQEYLNKTKVKSILKQYFITRKETYRIYGHKDYDPDYFAE